MRNKAGCDKRWSKERKKERKRIRCSTVWGEKRVWEWYSLSRVRNKTGFGTVCSEKQGWVQYPLEVKMKLK